MENCHFCGPTKRTTVGVFITDSEFVPICHECEDHLLREIITAKIETSTKIGEPMHRHLMDKLVQMEHRIERLLDPLVRARMLLSPGPMIVKVATQEELDEIRKRFKKPPSPEDYAGQDGDVDWKAKYSSLLERYHLLDEWGAEVSIDRDEKWAERTAARKEVRDLCEDRSEMQKKIDSLLGDVAELTETLARRCGPNAARKFHGMHIPVDMTLERAVSKNYNLLAENASLRRQLAAATQAQSLADQKATKWEKQAVGAATTAASLEKLRAAFRGTPCSHCDSFVQCNSGNGPAPRGEWFCMHELGCEWCRELKGRQPCPECGHPVEDKEFRRLCTRCTWSVDLKKAGYDGAFEPDRKAECKVRCLTCNGTGIHSVGGQPANHVCDTCRGEGYVPEEDEEAKPVTQGRPDPRDTVFQLAEEQRMRGIWGAKTGDDDGKDS